jgi:hypothetical protein
MTEARCKRCNSTEVRSDAWAEWDGEQWVLNSVFDNEWCLECDAETRVVYKEED